MCCNFRNYYEAYDAGDGDRPPPVDEGGHGLSIKPPIAGGRGVWASYEPPTCRAMSVIDWWDGGIILTFIYLFSFLFIYSHFFIFTFELFSLIILTY